MKRGTWREARSRTAAPTTCRTTRQAHPSSIRRWAEHMRTVEQQLADCRHTSTSLHMQLADDQVGINEDSVELRCTFCNELIAFGEGLL